MPQLVLAELDELLPANGEIRSDDAIANGEQCFCFGISGSKAHTFIIRTIAILSNTQQCDIQCLLD